MNIENNFIKDLLKKVSITGIVVSCIWASIMLVGWCFNKNIPSFFSNIYRSLFFLIIVIMYYVRYIIINRYNMDFNRIGMPDKTRQDLVMLVYTILQTAVYLVSPYCDASGFLKMPETFNFRLIGFILFFIAFSLNCVSLIYLGKNFSKHVTILDNHQLITKGIYAVIRHPWYLAQIIGVMAVPFIFLSYVGLILSLFSIPLMIYRVRREESLMSSEFGEEYNKYLQRTKKYIPFLF